MRWHAAGTSLCMILAGIGFGLWIATGAVVPALIGGAWVFVGVLVDAGEPRPGDPYTVKRAKKVRQLPLAPPPPPAKTPGVENIGRPAPVRVEHYRGPRGGQGVRVLPDPTFTEARELLRAFVDWFREHDGKADDFGRLNVVANAERFLGIDYNPLPGEPDERY